MFKDKKPQTIEDYTQIPGLYQIELNADTQVSAYENNNEKKNQRKF
ncbi:unnamed protein product (macronuclear) [Paramecium tetraurelia]|uniref:Uncharacterized protein n=1 Tax=Paramecium tetraurelia TaxID=5888 RepID=A0BX61_PARTE|nr:uncharacterized protein GSPATT00032980001 [Paramecium tetraurelia]CAK63128.1 unnamed protein product [Paramecium tetraurelia]|eukprot:XP_001430526.1 hypothetical protein (macronuclear) [Paramecium tetraurelia strain d4-2]